jgi:phosphatidylinositol 3-kinase
MLQVILNYSPSQPLTAEEKDIVWQFRFYLARDKKGLTKFLKSVAWRDSSEVKQAVEELLPQWTEIDTDDALELLGPGTVDSRVRAFAVKQLSRADDDVSFYPAAKSIYRLFNIEIGTSSLSSTTCSSAQI